MRHIVMTAFAGGQGLSTMAVVAAASTSGSVALATYDRVEFDDACAVAGVSVPSRDCPSVRVTETMTFVLATEDTLFTQDTVVHVSRDPDVLARLVASNDVSDLVPVMRGPSYMALRRGAQANLSPTKVILTLEPGRALTAADVASTFGISVDDIIVLAVDPGIARATDAGLLIARLPASVKHVIKQVL